MVFKRSLDYSENESAKRANRSSKESLEDLPITSEGQEDQGNETDKKVDNMMYACINGHLGIVKSLLKHGFDVNTIDNSNNTALDYAIQNSSFEIVKTLLENGASLNLVKKELLKFKTDHSVTALEFAARNGYLDMVKELLKAGAKAYKIDKYGRQFSVLTKLHFPVELSENHIEMIVEILKSHPHPIHEAINRLEVPKSIVIFHRLLEEGISPDLQDQCGDTALHRVVYELHSDVSLLVEVLKHGVNMEIKNNFYQETPLMTAFKVKRPEYVKELLKYGANPNHQISRLRGNTLLHEVCKSGDISMVKVLLNHGADVNGLGMDNRTPLHSTVLCHLDNTYQIIEELLLNGADINLKDNNNETVIHYAAYQGTIQENLFQELVKKCDDPNVVDAVEGKTPLHNAIEGGSESKVKILLDHGADPYIRDFDNPLIAKFDKNTAFETALTWRDEDTFKVMIYRN